jgi:hypothetical protein
VNRLLLCSLFLAAGTYCRASVILSINPLSQTVSLGSQASFDVDISGLGGGTALGTYDINLGFDSTLLSYDNTVFGNQVDISGLGDIQSVTPGTGTVEVFELSLDSPAELNSLQAPAFTLATLTFGTLAVGVSSPITLSVNALGDAYGNLITAALQDGAISVTSTSTVPEPKTTVLICLGSLAVLLVILFTPPVSIWGAPREVVRAKALAG